MTVTDRSEVERVQNNRATMELSQNAKYGGTFFRFKMLQTRTASASLAASALALPRHAVSTWHFSALEDLARNSRRGSLRDGWYTYVNLKQIRTSKHECARNQDDIGGMVHNVFLPFEDEYHSGVVPLYSLTTHGFEVDWKTHSRTFRYCTISSQHRTLSRASWQWLIAKEYSL